jgi:DHA3 family macrolide efflux protein-like MFS transporter
VRLRGGRKNTVSHHVTGVTRGFALGRDFWLFQVGQMISIVGDACGNIALAWWILDVTGSPATISAVLVPGMVVQTVLTPILGPFGDRLSRKWLIVGADVLRGCVMAALTAIVATGTFHLPTVVGVYALFAAGTALFNSSALSIVPQLVSVDRLPDAVRVSQSLLAVGRVGGGALGGLLVSWVGVGAAFAVDAVSFGVAVVATAAIRHTSSGRLSVASDSRPSDAVATFVRQLQGGFRVIYRIPVLLSLCAAVAFFNLVLSPMQVLLPTYAKVAKDMPAWFLGGLESSLGLGIVVGAVSIGTLEKIPRLISSVIVGLVFLGGAIALLPYAPGVIWPMLTMFAMGLGVAWTEIPIGARISVAVPDHFRSRVTSIFAFVFDGMAPLGIAVGGLLAAVLTVTEAMTGLGLAVLVALPMLLAVPGLVSFFRQSPSELADSFLAAHPEAFEREPSVKPAG